jgi:hypothetical protein
MRDRAYRPYLATPTALGHGNRHRCLVDIQPNENAIVHQARPPCLRLGTGPVGATLDQDMPQGGPPDFSAGEHTV